MILTIKHNRNVCYKVSLTNKELNHLISVLKLCLALGIHLQNDKGLTSDGTSGGMPIKIRISCSPQRVRLRLRKECEMSEYKSYYSIDLSFTKGDFIFFVRWLDIPNTLSNRPHGKYSYSLKWHDQFKGSGIDITKEFGGREKVLSFVSNPTYKSYKQYVAQHAQEYGSKEFINRNLHDLLFPEN